MKKTGMTLAALCCAAAGLAEDTMQPFNELGWGTLSGRVQTLSMHRDYETVGTAYGSSLGLELRYRSPVKEGWSIGAAYNGAGVLHSKDYGTAANPGEALIANGRVNVLNEGFLAYNMEAFGLADTTVSLGRKINHAEVFRADDFRQKSRAISAVQAASKDVENFRIAGGHSWRLSNWISAGDLWEFNDYGDVFGTPYDTDGITWAETAYTGFENIELVLFDAAAWDVANLLGARGRFGLGDDTALLGYLRIENDIGRAADRDAVAAGLSIEQQLEALKLEAGYFGVFGDALRFQETTTGINHALGSSMMIYSGQFLGDSHTFYAKAVTTLDSTRTTLYGLYNVTFHDQSTSGGRSGQELNVVAKQPIPKIENLSAALKFGIGYRDFINGAQDTLATDTRLFITYRF